MMMDVKSFYLFVIVFSLGTCCSGQKSATNHLVYVDKEGVIRYTKTKAEAAFYGVNYTIPFAYGYRSVKAINPDLKQEIDKDVYHLARIGVDAFRVHVWDVEISDAAGNLLQNDHLDLFDYLLAALKKRGIRTIITPIAFWGNGYPERDEATPGFSTKFGKGRANVNDTAIRAQEEYVRQFFRHVNPYTKSTYHNDPDVIAVEINNEPSHSGPKAGVTTYINRMVAAIQQTGWTKPLFYNISQNPFYADAVAASNVVGHSFQWYPSGLVANREVEGNFLPNVDVYAIPFDTIPAYRKKARMVYEFDAADILQSNMYPAMARSFKTAGFQWATQFAYDPLATAYGNTEYQTHYLNLAYTPAKAISMLIASRVFHRVPRLKSYGTYPADSSFDVFRVSYKNNLSEMNSDEEFYHSNATTSTPKSIAKLQHIAGVGSSPIVNYKGTGAYFLDKLENGVWRLEVMPDAIFIRDPFERASPKKEVSHIEWRRNDMTVSLPDLGDGFSLQALNAGNKFATGVITNSFHIEPGTYLLSKGGKQTGSAGSGYIGLREFVAPAERESAPQIRHEPPVYARAGTPLILQVQAAGVDSTDRISVQLSGAGRFGGRPISFSKAPGGAYEAVVPAEQLTPGIMSYRVILQKGGELYAFPGNLKGNPQAWDYINTAYYELRVAPENGIAPLFNAATDKQILTYSSSRRGSENKLIAGDRPGAFVYRVAAGDLTGTQVAAFQTSVSKATLADMKTVVLRARSGSTEPVNLRVILITGDAVPYAARITLPVTMQEIEIPLNQFRQDSMLLLPRPYPGFMPLWFTPGSQSALSINDLEKVQFVLDNDQSNSPKSYSMEIESAWIKK